MESRRIPIPTGPSVMTPSSSGPRWMIARHIRRISGAEAGLCQSFERTPTMPHIVSGAFSVSGAGRQPWRSCHRCRRPRAGGFARSATPARDCRRRAGGDALDPLRRAGWRSGSRSPERYSNQWLRHHLSSGGPFSWSARRTPFPQAPTVRRNGHAVTKNREILINWTHKAHYSGIRCAVQARCNSPCCRNPVLIPVLLIRESSFRGTHISIYRTSLFQE